MILPTLVIVSALITLSILIFGVLTMLRGGEFNKRNGNKLMRARIIMQGVTLMLIIVWFISAR